MKADQWSLGIIGPLIDSLAVVEHALTGPGTTTVASGDTLKSGPLTVSGGVLLDEGTVEPAGGQTTLTGGALTGNGTVRGSLTNTAGVLEPGDANLAGIMSGTIHDSIRTIGVRLQGVGR